MNHLSPVRLLTILTVALGACASDRQSNPDAQIVDSGNQDTGIAQDTGIIDAGAEDAAPPDTGPPPPFEISTDAFQEGEMIPLRFECGRIIQGPGDNISPQLEWNEGPAETMSYAIVMDDVDSGVVHWVVYDISPEIREIAENVPAGYELAEPAGAKQAEIQGSGYFGYFGPCSPQSINTYRWTVHALPTPTVTGADRTTTEYEMVDLIEAQSLDSASFSGES